jgi:hypothetical protein
MTQIGYPLASTQVNKPQDWSNMAQNWLGTGVIKGKLNELAVYADSTGMQTKIKTGQAHMQGHFFQSDAEETLAIATANSSNPRIDRIVVRLDYTSDSVQLAVLQGVPAVSPTAPALTQNSTRWEISLAQIYIGANVSTITAGNVTNERNFVQNANAIAENWTNVVTQNGWFHDSTYPCQYRKDASGNYVEFRGILRPGNLTNGVVPFIMPAGYRPIKKVDSITKNVPSAGGVDVTSVVVNTDGNAQIYDNMVIGYLTFDKFRYPIDS